jgi:polysaccharide export outer membrane protein
MKRVTTYLVLAMACCLVQQEWAVSQEASPSLPGAPPGSAATTRAGVAGGAWSPDAWSPALTGERRPLYRLQRSDVIEVDFTYSPEFNQSVSVQPDGFIALKGVKTLYVQGTTVPELEQQIEQAYTSILHDPEVTVVLKDFDKPSFIAAGEVARPGKYELRAEITVSAAVAIAGGFTPRAKHSQVVLFRRVSDDVVESRLLNVKSLLKSRNLAEDVYLRPGDMLFVPQNVMSKIKQYMPASGLGLYSNQF